MSTPPAGTYRLPVTIRSVTDVDRSGHWLSQGWQDFRKTPKVSLVYGLCFVAVSLLVTFGLFAAGLDLMIVPLGGGFVILAPLLVVGLYDVSRRLERGMAPSLRDVFSAFSENAGQLAAMGMTLMICYLVWVEIALVLFMGFFNQAPPSLDAFFEEILFTGEGAILLFFGSIVGAAFAAVIFSITAVSIPLIYDRPVDVVTAITVSLLAVRQNWRLMFGWAALIAVIAASALLTGMVPLAVAMPVLAYATWHAYRDLIGPPSEGSTASISDYAI